MRIGVGASGPAPDLDGASGNAGPGDGEQAQGGEGEGDGLGEGDRPRLGGAECPGRKEDQQVEEGFRREINGIRDPLCAVGVEGRSWHRGQGLHRHSVFDKSLPDEPAQGGLR